MKKMLAVALVLASIVSSASADVYQMVGEIVAFDTSSCYWQSVIVTEDGNEWYVDLEDEHNISDIIRVDIDDMGTASQIDDRIINIDFLFNAIEGI